MQVIPYSRSPSPGKFATLSVTLIAASKSALLKSFGPESMADPEYGALLLGKSTCFRGGKAAMRVPIKTRAMQRPTARLTYPKITRKMIEIKGTLETRILEIFLSVFGKYNQPFTFCVLRQQLCTSI